MKIILGVFRAPRIEDDSKREIIQITSCFESFHSLLSALDSLAVLQLLNALATLSSDLTKGRARTEMRTLHNCGSPISISRRVRRGRRTG